MALKLTEKAAGEVKRIMAEQKLPETAVLRVGVRGGGCSGFEYALGFDPAADELNDSVSDYHGVRVAVDQKSKMYLDGTEIDFYDGLEKRGFVFNNPNATKTCGCGTSFQV
jgi:iron-sulfur cluster assembly protein